MISKNWKIALIALSSLILLVLESIIKYSMVNKIPPRGFYLFKPVLQIIYTPNYNIAFSLPLPSVIVIVIVIVALIFLSYLWWQNYYLNKYLLLGATSLVIVGAFSNLMDRFLMGYVVDYINISIWPIFNLADCMIVIGLLAYILSEFKVKRS